MRILISLNLIEVNDIIYQQNERTCIGGNMRDNQEMASVIFNSNLASEDIITQALSAVTPTKDVGKVLVEQGVLDEQTYRNLIDFIDSLHPENLIVDSESVVIQPDEVYEPSDPTISDLFEEEDESSILAPSVTTPPPAPEPMIAIS